jgi:hypothetical protein
MRPAEVPVVKAGQTIPGTSDWGMIKEKAPGWRLTVER